MVHHFTVPHHTFYCPSVSHCLILSSEGIKIYNLTIVYTKPVNNTFAMLSGQEKYDVLKEGFSPVLREINDLVDSGSININGVSVSINFF